MANIKSQIKRNRQNIKAHERNKAIRTGVRTHVKAFRAAVAEGDASIAAEAYKAVSRTMDRAVTRGVMKKQTAARQKSRMHKHLAKMS